MAGGLSQRIDAIASTSASLIDYFSNEGVAVRAGPAVVNRYVRAVINIVFQDIVFQLTALKARWRCNGRTSAAAIGIVWIDVRSAVFRIPRLGAIQFYCYIKELGTFDMNEAVTEMSKEHGNSVLPPASKRGDSFTNQFCEQTAGVNKVHRVV